MGRRVVITGLGVVSPLGVGARDHWSALASGRSAVARIERLTRLGFPVDVAAEVAQPNFAACVSRLPRKQGAVDGEDAPVVDGRPARSHHRRGRLHRHLRLPYHMPNLVRQVLLLAWRPMDVAPVGVGKTGGRQGDRGLAGDWC